MIKESIKRKLAELFEPDYLDVINESSAHNVPEGSETHFKVIVVSSSFEGKSRVKRQQAVYSALQAELEQGVHALAQFTFTPDEWAQERNQQLAGMKPQCIHGGQRAKS